MEGRPGRAAVVVLVSGTGTLLQALLDAAADEAAPFRVACDALEERAVVHAQEQVLQHRVVGDEDVRRLGPEDVRDTTSLGGASACKRRPSLSFCGVTSLLCVVSGVARSLTCLFKSSEMELPRNGGRLHASS